MSSPINVEPITHKINLGKGPVWDSASERLYFVDMFQGNVHSYTPTNQNVHSALVGSGKFVYIITDQIYYINVI